MEHVVVEIVILEVDSPKIGDVELDELLKPREEPGVVNKNDNVEDGIGLLETLPGSSIELVTTGRTVEL